jgi:hypothetical protein
MEKNHTHWIPRSMPRTTKALACLAIGLALTAYSGVKTHVDHGRVTARTFSFLEPPAKPFPSYAENRKEAHEAIQQALIKSLGTRGINYVKSGGDVTLAYLLIVGNNGQTTSLNSYFGYGDEASDLVDKVHKEQTNSKNRGYFEAGTLVIDLVNPQTSKLLQRRSIQAPLLRNLPKEKRIERLQTLVDTALKDVPVFPQ